MSGAAIEGYLDRLRAGLPAVPAARWVLVEVEDGLRSAAEEQAARGCDPERAAERAVAEFGDPEALAAEFVPLVAAAETHRDGAGLLMSGPVVGGLWLAAALPAWSAAPRVVGVAAVAVGLVLVTVIPRVLYAVAAASPRSRVAALAGATRSTAVLDAALVLIATPALVLMGGSAAGVVPLAAAAASLTRLALTLRMSRRLDGVRAVLAAAA